MKKLIIFSLLFLSVHVNIHAEEGDIIISNEWARPILIAGRPGGAYFQIKNNGAQNDKLISVSSSISPRVEIHQHTMKDGIMKMGKVDNIEIAAGGSVQLKPGGYHIMLFNANDKYAPGDEIDLQLIFEKAGVIEKTLKILARQP